MVTPDTPQPIQPSGELLPDAGLNSPFPAALLDLLYGPVFAELLQASPAQAPESIETDPPAEEAA